MATSWDLPALGWNENVAQRWRSVAGPHNEGLVAGRVIRASRRFVDVACSDGVLRTEAPVDLDPPAVTGDWVVLDRGRPGAVKVTAVAPRQGQLARRDPSGRPDQQVLAANVDEVWIVVGLDRDPNGARIERSLVLGWASGAEPLVVLAKADLATDLDAATDAMATVAGDTEVVLTSAVTGEGLPTLAQRLAVGRTAVLLGASGVGKSTLLNSLAGAELARTAEVRATDAKGRHTTVTRDLFVLPGGGVIIDTPGLRSMGLLDADEGLASAFSEVSERAQQCRFRDCAHDSEPGCAVREAVAAGHLDPARLQHYQQMRRELDEASSEATEADRRARRGGRPQNRPDPNEQ